VSPARNQHYVARLHLRQFACETGKNPHILAFDKTRRKVIRPSIRTIAADVHFYESSDTGVERLLGKAESAFAPVYQRLRETPSIDGIEEDDRVVVALFLAAQMIRTVEFREGVKSVTALIDDWSKREGHDLDPSYTTVSEEEVRQIQISSLVNQVPEIADVMLQMKWVRLQNETSMPLWTSDHPINLYNPRPSGVSGNLGLKSRGIQVFFPLAPSLTLCLCDPIDYGELPNDGVMNDIQNITFQNDLQLRSATRFVFSRSGDFALATEILDLYPEVGDPDRPRVQRGGDLR
jgi:Protein of unknown function (DUF4238)